VEDRQAVEAVASPDGALVEAIAQRTAELVLEHLGAGTAATGRRWVDARTLAVHLGTSAEWVRDHADELGARRLTDSARPRLRFDLARALDAADARSVSKRSQASEPAKPSAKRRRRAPADVELLPIRRPNAGRHAA
jgi:hypothetical protein